MTKKPQRNKTLHPSQSKSPLKVQDPRIYEGMPFRWRATSKYIDYDDKEWGWEDIKTKRFFNHCLTFLQHYEDKTWAQMKEERHCHLAPLSGIAVRAQNRISKIHGDMNELYQVKAQGKCRLFGHIDRQYFYLIWHDAKHTVYPRGE
ncbi:hypothetical protein ACFLVW_07710 [Chloroflexota bacterium]